jgi:hypothetical protein
MWRVWSGVRFGEACWAEAERRVVGERLLADMAECGYPPGLIAKAEQALTELGADFRRFKGARLN